MSRGAPPGPQVRPGADGDWEATLSDHRSRNRERIAATAMELIGEHGLAHVSMSLLAERAGVSRATLYHYFPDLDHVLLAWVELQVDRFVSRVEQLASAEPDPRARLALIIAQLSDYFASRDHRLGLEQLGNLAVAPATARAVAERMAPLMGLVADCLRTGQEVGVFRSDLDAEVHAALILGLLGAIRPHLVSGRYTPGTAAGAVSSLVLEGVSRR
jgi:AcrR family transcriptional regulator